jgi:hypothetical protein
MWITYVKIIIMFKKIYNVALYSFAIIGFLLIMGFFISKSGLTDKVGIIDTNTDYYSKNRNIIDNKNYTWLNTEEYISLKEALKNEKIVLSRVEKETNIKARLILSILFVEQMRLYTSNRELFKKIFEPLKILGVQSQFSWGILGLKQETLIQIEDNLASSTSTFYLGQTSKNLLSSNTTSTEERENERFIRITDEHNSYYSYLYASLFIKQIINQWDKAGFDISNKPEILATLYNIGFSHSIPKANPQVGGAEIDINDTKYSFGKLAYEFYYSNELLDVFPR